MSVKGCIFCDNCESRNGWLYCKKRNDKSDNVVEPDCPDFIEHDFDAEEEDK